MLERLVIRSFTTAFRSLPEELRKAYPSKPAWTEIMRRVVWTAWREFRGGRAVENIEYYREMYTVDHAFCQGGKACFEPFGKDAWWPADLAWLVEVENGNHPEEEMWKLAYWRARHKILFVDDYAEDDKIATKPKRRTWLDTQKQTWRSILRKVHANLQEDERIRYYLFASNYAVGGRDLQWRWFVFSPTGKLLDESQFTLSP